MADGLKPSGRDDVLFGRAAKDRRCRKEPPLPPDLARDIEVLESSDKKTPELCKSLGNRCFEGKMFLAAVKCYSKGIECDESNEVLYSNRSAAYVQSSLVAGPSLAVKDALKCTQLKPEWFKGHLRLGDALFASGKIPDAIEAYTRCLQLNPACETARESKKFAEDALRGEATADGAEEGGEASANPYNHYSLPKTAEEKQREEDAKHLSVDELLSSWKQDVVQPEKEVTARRRYKGNIEEADRTAAQSYKAQLLNAFRTKVAPSQPVH